MTKSAHFIPIVESISSEKPADIYIREVIVQHGVSILAVLDRDVRFTSTLLRMFHEELGSQLQFSTTYHSRTDGQSKWMI